MKKKLRPLIVFIFLTFQIVRDPPSIHSLLLFLFYFIHKMPPKVQYEKLTRTLMLIIIETPNVE